jgi:hypothetical protein
MPRRCKFGRELEDNYDEERATNARFCHEGGGGLLGSYVLAME